MDGRGGFVQKILFIHTVFIYTGCVHFVPFGGRKFDRRNEVLAETGGAVSALTPREHTVLRQQRAVTGPRGNAWLSAAHPCRCRRRAGKPFMERTNYRPGQTPPATGRDKLATGSGKVRQLIVLLNHRRRAYGRNGYYYFDPETHGCCVATT